MKVIILAGGKGLRLRKVVKDVPKPLAAIAGKPFLEYLILQLIKFGFRDIVFSVGYQKEAIKEYFGNGKKWRVSISYAEEKKPLGTGGAIKKAARLIDDKEFLVLNGDSFLDLDFNRLIEFHRRHKTIATLGLVRVDNLSRYGKVELNRKNRVIKFSEKKSTGKGIINGGVCVLNRKALVGIPTGKVSFEKDILPGIIRQGVYGFVSNGFFVDIGVPEDYLRLSHKPGKLLKAAGAL